MPTTSARINYIRNRIETSYLTDRCAFQVKDIPANGPWQSSPAYTTVATEVPCRFIQQEKPTQVESTMLSGQEVLPTYYLLEVPHDQVVEIDFRVNFQGEYYEIVRIEDGLTDKTFKQLLITRKKGQG